MTENRNTPFQIGRTKIPGRVIFAPMAGVSDLPFRLLCREQGASLVCMEMISAKAITYKNVRTAELMETSPEEAPVSLQLFGCEPEIMARACEMIEDRPFDILDINMGCPVHKVVSNGEGSALMRDPVLAGRVIAAAVRAASLPVTVKIRAGWDREHINAPEVALALEEAGVSMISVHGRTREEMYRGRADYSVITRVKDAVFIPVIGNGDIRDASDVRRMFLETGCDGIAIGRGARGNPWIFSEIESEILGSEKIARPTPEEVARMVIRHARELSAERGEKRAIQEMRKHASFYTAGLPGSSSLRSRINSCSTLSELKETMSAWVDN